jgi:uncharacterized protein YbgA (DUF1722 family)
MAKKTATKKTAPTEAQLLEWATRNKGYLIVKDDEGQWQVGLINTERLHDHEAFALVKHFRAVASTLAKQL